jgi:hypothetical protein
MLGLANRKLKNLEKNKKYFPPREKIRPDNTKGAELTLICKKKLKCQFLSKHG